MDLDEQLELFSRLCPCCGVDSENEPFPICCDNMDLADLGEGYVLLFKLMIYFGLIGIIFYGLNIYKVVINLQGTNCVSRPLDLTGSDLQIYGQDKLPPCYNDGINPHSVANYGLEKMDKIERSLMVSFLAFFWVAIAAVYARVKSMARTIDEKNDTPSDWTLWIKNLPHDEDEDALIANLSKDELFATDPEFKIKKVSLAYNLEEYIKIVEELSKKKVQVKKLQFQDSKGRKTLVSIPELPDQKQIFGSPSHENMSSPSNSARRSGKPHSLEKSITMKRRKIEVSGHLKAEIEQMKELNIKVAYALTSWEK